MLNLSGVATAFSAFVTVVTDVDDDDDVVVAAVGLLLLLLLTLFCVVAAVGVHVDVVELAAADDDDDALVVDDVVVPPPPPPLLLLTLEAAVKDQSPSIALDALRLNCARKLSICISMDVQRRPMGYAVCSHIRRQRRSSEPTRVAMAYVHRSVLNNTSSVLSHTT